MEGEDLRAEENFSNESLLMGKSSERPEPGLIFKKTSEFPGGIRLEEAPSTHIAAKMAI